jgi:hypothetical protein
MKIIEVLKFNRELLKRVWMTGVRLEDTNYIDLYSDYEQLRQRGEKITYIVASLSIKYAVSERTVYNIIRRLGKDCSGHAY